MKVTTDACVFGAWVAEIISTRQWARCQATSENDYTSLLDIGTGTGLLSLMVAQKNEVFIDAIEIETVAAGQAEENVAASPWPHRINIIRQDVLQWQPTTKYPVIFSNPPFYQNELKGPGREKNIAHHDEGLQLPALLHFIKTHLKPAGIFFLLLPAKREKEINLLLAEAGLFIEKKVRVQQTLKHQPIRLMIQGRVTNVKQKEEATFVIRNEAGDYTPQFQSLLKDYYLYL